MSMLPGLPLSFQGLSQRVQRDKSLPSEADFRRIEGFSFDWIGGRVIFPSSFWEWDRLLSFSGYSQHPKIPPLFPLFIVVGDLLPFPPSSFAGK